MSTMTVTPSSKALQEVLLIEVIDASLLVGRCTMGCVVTVDEIVDGQTAIRHDDEAFPVKIGNDVATNYWKRQYVIIGPYVRWLGSSIRHPRRG